jgi:hypothetical protein
MRLLTIAAALLFSAISVFAADVSGAWTMSLETPQGSMPASLTLKQDGDAVSGTYRGPRNEAPAAGTLKDNDLKLSVSINAGGQSVTLTIAAKVAGDKMDGTLDFAGQQTLKFSATKKP